MHYSDYVFLSLMFDTRSASSTPPFIGASALPYWASSGLHFPTSTSPTHYSNYQFIPVRTYYHIAITIISLWLFLSSGRWIIGLFAEYSHSYWNSQPSDFRDSPLSKAVCLLWGCYEGRALLASGDLRASEVKYCRLDCRLNCQSNTEIEGGQLRKSDYSEGLQPMDVVVVEIQVPQIRQIWVVERQQVVYGVIIEGEYLKLRQVQLAERLKTIYLIGVQVEGLYLFEGERSEMSEVFEVAPYYEYLCWYLSSALEGGRRIKSWICWSFTAEAYLNNE